MNPLKMIATLGVAAAVVTGVAYASPSQYASQDNKKESKKAEKADAAKVGSPAPARRISANININIISSISSSSNLNNNNNTTSSGRCSSTRERCCTWP